MSSQQNFIDFIVDQIKDQDKVRYKKMFGEYCLYYDNKVVALICDNKLFIKDTPDSRSFAKEKSDIKMSPPFPGAKDWILVEEEIENSEFINELIEITAKELTLPKVKSEKKDATKK